MFFISHPKHVLWVLKRTVSMRRFFFEHPKHMLRLLGKNKMPILRSKFLLNWSYEVRDVRVVDT